MPKSTKPKVEPKKCIFCGLPKKMSGEHIWGKWLKRYLRLDQKRHTIKTHRILSPTEPEHTHVGTRTGDPLRSHVDVVCVDCNSQWLSQIQDQARPHLIPLILGKVVALSPITQNKIATWCAMATMTSEYLDRDPEAKAITQIERKWFSENRRVPPNWRVWIARYQRHRWKGQWIHVTAPILFGKEISKLSPGEYSRANTQTTTFAIGELYVHTMSSTNTDLINQWAWPPFSRISRLMIQIWPPKESLIAWPSDSLRDEEADLIPTIFDRVVDNASRSVTGRRLF